MKKTAVLWVVLLVLFVGGCQGTGQQSSSEREAGGGMTVHFIDVGQADATLLEFDGYTLLIDAGDWNATDVVDYLEAQSVDQIDVAIVTHPDADHIGQLDKVIERFAVGEVWMSGNESTSDTFIRVLAAIDAADIPYEEPAAGDAFDIGPLGIEVLHPAELTGNTNEESLVLRLIYGDTVFLFTGDAGVRSEKEMIASGADLDADILHLGHHGSNTSSSTEFLRAVTPDVAVYSAGAGNSYGHPHAEVLASVENEGVEVYGTDVNGTVIVTTDGEAIELSLEKGGVAVEGENRCLDINLASSAELQQLDGIGEALAAAIIAERPFDSLDELLEVSGIGDGKLKAIRAQGLACWEGTR